MHLLTFNNIRIYAVPKCGYCTITYYYLKYKYPKLFKKNLSKNPSPKNIFKTVQQAWKIAKKRGEHKLTENIKDFSLHDYYIYIRNPFDRIYSSYLYRKKKYNLKEFNTFINNRLESLMYKDKHIFPMWYLFKKYNVIKHSNILKFENFSESFKQLLINNNINETKINNYHKNKKKKNYKKIYTQKSINKIKKLYAWDIKNFNYNFDNTNNKELNLQVKDLI